MILCSFCCSWEFGIALELHILQQVHLVYIVLSACTTGIPCKLCCHTCLTVVHCMVIRCGIAQESEGNILDDEVLINTLNNSKLTAGKQTLLVVMP